MPAKFDHPVFVQVLTPESNSESFCTETSCLALAGVCIGVEASYWPQTPGTKVSKQDSDVQNRSSSHHMGGQWKYGP